MKILYRQPEEGSILEKAGLHNCYLKLLQTIYDTPSQKEHHHRDYELHMILEGGQYYQAEGKNYRLTPGRMLLIPPGIPHRVLESLPQTRKVGITFRLTEGGIPGCREGAMPQRLLENLTVLEAEARGKQAFSGLLLESCLLETVLTALRCAGLEAKSLPQRTEENAVLSLAKQYIADNIDRAPEVDTVAQYCYVSSKQLTRLFQRIEGLSPGAYILQTRVARMEELLREGTQSLKQISETMHFSSEYYCNAFFKKHAGMPPGAYRKMHEK